MMKSAIPLLLFAPMEGVTDVIYRRAHHELFGGVDEYYLPFISPTQSLKLSPRDYAALLPENNGDLICVPQLLTKDADVFIRMSSVLRDLGYHEINLNIGCPSGTVTAKGKGSGMLRDLQSLSRFLDDICLHSALPVSVKTRIGYESVDEWDAILSLLCQYPLSRLIIHPRTRQELYKGEPHLSCYEKAVQNGCPCPVYNGNLFDVESCIRITEHCTQTQGLMLGRGLIANPALCRMLRGGSPLTRWEVIDFHDELLRRYTSQWPVQAVLGHLCEIMSYLSCCFEDTHKPLKAMRKARTLDAYCYAARELFEEHAFIENASYSVVSV